jgi:hypothetical protein
VVLPLVLTSLDTYQGGRYFHLRELTRLVYRYVMPILFACAGAAAAYFVFVADG